MKTTKKLMIATLGAAALVQSTATLADTAPSNGLCTAMPTWTSGWLPCFTGQGGNSGARH